MSANSIDTALAELEAQINSCEKAVLRFIEEKKMKSENSVSNSKLNRQLQQNPIAIIGMASLFPQAKNLREYWQNIVNKADCITDVPDTHWSVEDYYDPNPRTPEDKTYCKRGGFLPEVDFNPMEFGIPPSILEVTDVSQLLSLLVAKAAMDDAGYGESRDFDREMVGVVLGVAMAKQLGMPLSARLEYPIWEKVLKSSGLSDEDTQKIVEKIKSAYVKWDENAFPGMLANVVAGRIANRLNFGGMNCVVDAACASSFGALKVAISELVEYRSDMMLTGGVDTDNTIMAYISFSKTPAVSPSENVKPFDAKSDGMMLGEGIGMVVLKRLEDAVRDNDRIYAVIRGIGTSSDGRYKSIYAPRKEGQIKALERAYNDAGFSPATVGLMEAHGTGTMAGDPTEFGSLRDFFALHDTKKQHIALGSVKSQIGHTKAAAGAASLIKTALALHHKILPPTINITEPNPKLNIQNSAFYLNTETRPWIKAEGEAPRRAGISSFGFGGTNYHVILEEYEAEQEKPYRLHHTPSEVLLFAPNSSELITKLEATLANLRSPDGARHYNQLTLECQSLSIPQTAARIGFVAENLPEACKLLQIAIDTLKLKSTATNWEHPQGVFYRAAGMELNGKVVALFSGQGSQYLEMGREAVMNFPELRRLYSRMDSLLIKDNLQPISDIVFPHPVFEEAAKTAQIATLQRTEYAQPAIGVFSAGLYSVLQQAGFKADFTAGHSFGELTALWAAGVLSEDDYLFLVKSRGQAMAAPKDPDHDAGSMLAVKEDISKIEPVLRHYPQVAIANHNSPSQVVLAGPTAEIIKINNTFQELGYGAVQLPVSAAFHTPLIAFAQKSFAIATKSVTFQAPKIPVFSNVTGKPYTPEPAAIQRTLEGHLASSVLFKQEIENIYNAGGRVFVEFGPKRILSNLVKDILGDKPHITVSLNPSTQKNSDRSLREAAVQLRVIGMTLALLDPYQVPAPLPAAETKKGLSVKLCGINYRSEKSKNAFIEALNDGFKVSNQESGVRSQELEVRNQKVEDRSQESGVRSQELEVRNQKVEDKQPEVKVSSELLKTEQLEMIAPAPIAMNGNGNGHKKAPTITAVQPQTQPVILAQQPIQEVKMAMSPDKLVTFQQAIASLENLLAQFQQNQSENLQVHGQYLNHQMEYAKTFFQLMQQQHTLFANSASTAEATQIKQTVMESVERSMMQFHTQQGETLRVHEQYLQEQVEYTKNFFQLIQQEYSQIIAGEGVTVPEVKEIISATPVTQAPVSPTVKIVDTPPLSVVDTPVKDIAPVIPAPVPVVPAPPAVVPAPETIFSAPETILPASDAIIPAPVAIASAPDTLTSAPATVVKAPELTPVSSGTNIDDIGDNLLAITSDKTGYPIEMLELDMDMEADLGIDSIKRVEILGALQELYPNLPKPNLEELSEKRTIGQVVDYLQTHASRSLSVEIAITQAQQAAAALATSQLKAEAPATELLSPSPNTPSPDEYANLAQTLLTITSEKTGYPVEMLELEMDMEADLGIDSIKRVEILGAMQETYPNLPKPNVEELGDLRTIGQIVDYLQQLVGGEKKKYQFDQPLTDDGIREPNFQSPIPNPQSPPPIVDPNLPRRPVKLKTLPRPDYWETKLPEGHIGLITDDGSLTTTKLAHALLAQGWKVVVLSFPQSLVPEQFPLPVGVERVILQNLTEEHLQQQLQVIASQYGAIGAFIHLHPAFTNETKGVVKYLEAEKAIVKHMFLMAKHLKASLNQAATQEGRTWFCTVAHLDGAFGLDFSENFGVIGAGLFGLVKSLRWEWPKVFLRAIDINRTLDPHQSAQYIVSELYDSNRYIREVGYSSKGRVTLVAEAE